MYRLLIDFVNVRESVHDKGTEKNSVGYFILLYGETLEVCEGFELGDLDETVDVVVLE